ncbi:MAG: DUF1330 domain-containing protein [Pseudomonadales bacterium]|nr:DUF1330 domain-containing protein [Pseudomonadales bacterium]
MTTNSLQPTGDQVRAFRDRATGEPVQMLNLLKFRAIASYADGRETSLTGEEAYSLYGKAFEEIMGPRGARVIYAGAVRGFLIGEGEGSWDAAMLVEYPSTQVMLDMWRIPAYQEAQKHREAGLEGQLLLECGPGFSFSPPV